MKRLITVFSFIVLFFASDSLIAQVAEDAWSFGFGGVYPRFQSTDVRPKEANYGGYISIGRHFTENVALTLNGYYLHMVGAIPVTDPNTGLRYRYPNGTLVPYETEVTTDIMAGTLDLLYYFVPCSDVSPYLSFGLGGAYSQPDWDNIVINPTVEDKFSLYMDFGLGAEWALSDNWELNTHFVYSSLDGAFDGVINQQRKGIFGSSADAFISIKLGLLYYFAEGPESEYCQLWEGISADIPDNLATVEDVERIVKENIPEEVIKEVVVEKMVQPDKEDWILFGVNFEFDEATLEPEAIPILEHAVDVLDDNPDMRIQIQGHTDYIGTEAYNQKLSERRANTVKEYLVEHGISANRLTTKGFGESQPIATNETAFGRAQNRRVEFKILNPGMENEARD